MTMNLNEKNPSPNSGLKPMIWSKKLGQSIPYIKDLETSEKKFLKESKGKGLRILEKIRSVYYGKSRFSQAKASENKPANAGIQKEKAKEIPAAPKLKEVALKVANNENVTKPGNTFEQNIDAVAKEFLGKGSGPGKVINENVTRTDMNFEQNLSAIDEAFLGHGSGPGKMITENVTDPKKSAVENLDAIAEAFPNVSAKQSGFIKNSVKKNLKS